jgi:BirA family biotin operon repressor/biotin-[acetyl-CoA-carboxylase] ligase
VLTEHSVAEAAVAAGLPVPASYVETTGSTNADLMAVGDAGAPAWTVLVAGHQTAGRGRMGRSWEAPPGSSLLVSVLLRPSVVPVFAPLLSLAAAVAMAEAIWFQARLRISFEWPNDLVTEAGKKLGGVLAESKVEGDRVDHAVVGVGVNLTQSDGDFPTGLRLPPTSVAMEGVTPEPATILRSFLEGLYHLCAPDREAFGPTVLEAYRPRCATVGRRVRATTIDGPVVEGRASGIGANGELIVTTEAGVVTVSSGEVERLD